IQKGGQTLIQRLCGMQEFQCGSSAAACKAGRSIARDRAREKREPERVAFEGVVDVGQSLLISLCASTSQERDRLGERQSTQVYGSVTRPQKRFEFHGRKAAGYRNKRLALAGDA